MWSTNSSIRSTRELFNGNAEESVAQLVNDVYKNILDKFNPCAKQIISAGKVYLKAMHGAASASEAYIESLSKMAKCSQEGVWGGSMDIGDAFFQLVRVHKDVANMQMNVLKAFYVDLIVPLESNLEKDSKAVTVNLKKFSQQHKINAEAVAKATSVVKKERKKFKSGRLNNIDKEIKNLEEKKQSSKQYDNRSLKAAIKEERWRYGFILERQCSLAKHSLAYHEKADELYKLHLPQWQTTFHSRDTLPEHILTMFPREKDVNEENYLTIRMTKSETEKNFRAAVNQQTNQIDINDNTDYRKRSVSMDFRRTYSTGNLDSEPPDEDNRSYKSLAAAVKPQPIEGQISRARSEANLQSSQVIYQEDSSRPKSMIAPVDNRISKAVYTYLSSGDNQLSFYEGDMILLIGERNNGWQFGENLRNNRNGWFPVAYTQDFLENHENGLPSEEIIMAANPVPVVHQSQIYKLDQSHHQQYQEIGQPKIVPPPPPLPANMQQARQRAESRA